MADGTLNTSLLHKCVDGLQAGDNKATNDLILASCCRLDRLARKMLNSFPKVARWEQAEDVLQNAMVRLMRALKVTKPESTRAYFALAAEAIRRELLDLLDRYRCQKRAMEAHHDSRFHGMGKQADSSALPWDPADPQEDHRTAEQWEELHAAVALLPPQEAEVFGLIFYNGLNNHEVASLRDMSERTVQRRWKSACERLRQQFGDGLPLE